MNQSATTADQPEPPSTRPFFILWGGQALSLLGSRVARFALIWWLTRETGSVQILATAALLTFLPQVLLGPLAGTLIDRYSRHRTLLISDGTIAFFSLVLMVLFWFDQVAIWHVMVLMLIRAMAAVFHQPTMMASTSMMVPKEQLTRIQGFNQTLQGLLLIVAPPLGALLLEVMPISAILGIDVVTAAFAIVPLFIIKVPQPKRSAEQKKVSVMADFMVGLRFLRSWPGLLILMVMAMLVNFFATPVSVFVPILVKDHFGGGPLQFAWMSTAFGFGVIAGGATISVWGGFRRRVATSLAGLVGFGLSLSILGLVPSSMYILALGGIFSFGFMATMTNAPMQAVMQSTVPVEYQGRVFTMLHTLVVVAAPLSLAIAGPLAEVAGVQIWFLTAAVVSVAMGLLGFLLPMVLYLEDSDRRTPDTDFAPDDRPLNGESTGP